MLEKGKAPGSHLLSGAVVNPRGLQRLFRGRKRIDEMPFYGEVEGESVLFLTKRRAMRIPTPPTMVNHRNYIASLSRLGRWLAEEAEALGVTILPETSAEQLLVDGGRVRRCAHRRPRPRPRRVRSSANFEPGSDVTARVTILAEGTQGHLTGAALDQFGLQSDNPQVWALGVKEVWKVAKPLHRGDPHDGLAAARRPEVPRVRWVVRLPDGRRHGHDRDGRRARLSRRGAVGARPAAGAEDASAHPARSSRAASACSGARRRSRRAGSSRSRSGSMRPGCCSPATASGW